jgi:hypothetical protein
MWKKRRARRKKAVLRRWERGDVVENAAGLIAAVQATGDLGTNYPQNRALFHWEGRVIHNPHSNERFIFRGPTTTGRTITGGRQLEGGMRRTGCGKVENRGERKCIQFFRKIGLTKAAPCGILLLKA